MARKHRHWSAAEKVGILEEARSAGATLAEVLRRHGIDAATYYRWEKQTREGMRQALNGKPQGSGPARDREIERLKAELEKKSRIIAEVVAENLELKKGSETGREWPVHSWGKGRGSGGSGADSAANAPRRVFRPRWMTT